MPRNFFHLFSLAILCYGHLSLAATITWSAPLYNGATKAGPPGAGIPHTEIPLGNGAYSIIGSREEPYAGGKRIIATQSLDGGLNWTDISTMLDDATPNLDMGDGSMLYDTYTSPPTLFYVYRRNVVPPNGKSREYSIRVLASEDKGRTWTHHSIVKKINPPDSRVITGLWTPVLLRTLGTALGLHCIYDDGDLPDKSVAPGNVNQGQWSYKKQWNEATRRWEPADGAPQLLVAQSPAGRISAEGARTVVRVGAAGSLWSPVESSVGIAPHRALALRYTSSKNSGVTWSLTRAMSPGWTEETQEDGPFLYSKPPEVPGHPGFFYDWSWPLAVRLPATASTTSLMVVVVFRSDEDLPPELAPSLTAGNDAHDSDKKLFYLLSTDGAVTWTKGRISNDIHRDHGVVALHDGSVLLGYSLKYTTPRKYVIRRGVVIN